MTLRCVIVDDSPAVLRAARKLLQGEGIAVVAVARTGEEALRLTEALKPDVVLIDIDLGYESGLDLARRIAQSGVSQGSRTILISAYDSADFGRLIAESPAIGFVPKADLSAAAIHRLLSGAQDKGT